MVLLPMVIETMSSDSTDPVEVEKESVCAVYRLTCMLFSVSEREYDDAAYIKPSCEYSQNMI